MAIQTDKVLTYKINSLSIDFSTFETQLQLAFGYVNGGTFVTLSSQNVTLNSTQTASILSKFTGTVSIMEFLKAELYQLLLTEGVVSGVIA